MESIIGLIRVHGLVTLQKQMNRCPGSLILEYFSLSSQAFPGPQVYVLCCRQSEYELTNIQVPIAGITHGKSSIESMKKKSCIDWPKTLENKLQHLIIPHYSNICVNCSSPWPQPSPRCSSQGSFSHFSGLPLNFRLHWTHHLLSQASLIASSQSESGPLLC